MFFNKFGYCAEVYGGKAFKRNLLVFYRNDFFIYVATATITMTV